MGVFLPSSWKVLGRRGGERLNAALTIHDHEP
jgi:hypothetical protein